MANDVMDQPAVSTSQGAGAPAAPQGAQPAQSTPDSGTTPGQGQPQSGADNIRQLREAYEGVKAKYEPWDKLGITPDQVGQFSTVYQKVYGEVASLGRELGYPDQEIAEALAEDPVRTLDFLRNEAQRIQAGAQQADPQQELREQMMDVAQEALQPIYQQQNLERTDRANTIFEQTAYQEVVEVFKGEGIDAAQIPQDEKDFIIEQASELLKYDEAALRDLKYNGKTTAVRKAVRDVMTRIDKYYLSRTGRDRNRVQPARLGQPAAPQGARKPTLDEIIENPNVIDEAQGRRGADGRYR